MRSSRDNAAPSAELTKESIACIGCGRLLSAENKFCGNCGLWVAHAGSIQTGQLHAQTTGRRYVSTLFADVVSSTDVVRHLDPEQFERFMKLYQSICDQVVGDFGGKIIEVLGDGIVAMLYWKRKFY